MLKVSVREYLSSRKSCTNSPSQFYDANICRPIFPIHGNNRDWFNPILDGIGDVGDYLQLNQECRTNNKNKYSLSSLISDVPNAKLLMNIAQPAQSSQDNRLSVPFQEQTDKWKTG